MDFKGLVITVDNAAISDDVTSYEPFFVEHCHTISERKGLVTSEVQLSLVSIAEPSKKHLAVATKLNFWINDGSGDSSIAERILYSVKTQFSQSFFVLYQLMTERNLGHVHIHAIPDFEMYQNIKAQLSIADLSFDNSGRYRFPF